MPRTRDKAASHERIINEASVQLRRDGADRVSVASLMRRAGLTHGGFYRHFASREALIDEAMESALRFDDTLFAEAGLSRDSLRGLIEVYVSARHRDAPEAGCGAAGLAGDVARGNAAGKAAYARQVEANVESLAGQIGAADGLGAVDGAAAGSAADEVRRRALVAMSTMVGAVVMARASAGSPISDELLAAVREHLLDTVSP